MAYYTAKEKRLTLRKKWRTKIVFEDEFGEGIIYLYSQDISPGGLYLEDSPPLKLGGHLFLSFVLPGKKRPLRLTGEIVRFVEHDSHGDSRLRRGAGVRFVDVDPKTRLQIAEFVRK